jgi:hypothetical protein
MAISYPLTMPTVTGIATIEMRAINAVAYSRSPFTFSGQVHAYAGQMWQADVSLPPMRRGDAEVWLYWLVSLKGQLGTFKLGDPLGCMPRGSARDADTILVDGTVSSGGSIGINSAPTSRTNYLMAGDYVQIGAGINQQLFKVLQNVSTDGSGTATLDVWPNVRSSIGNATSVKVQDTTGLFRLSSNEQSWSANQAIYGITFGASEAL